ncbi:hypothetical protein [Galbibacter sp. BG1]
MTKYYFMFGMIPVVEYESIENIKNFDVEKLDDGNLYIHDERIDSPIDLLHASNCWKRWVQLSEEEYLILNKIYNEYKANQIDVINPEKVES